eukprot:COSAG02_NODE_4729_length_5044_cov_2.301517_5_plen_76_part_01
MQVAAGTREPSFGTVYTHPTQPNVDIDIDIFGFRNCKFKINKLKITGLYSHTHAHTCIATQVYDLKSGYVGGPGLL